MNFLGKVDKDSANTYSDEQLEKLLEYALDNADMNDDGFVDYTEYRFNNDRVRVVQEENKDK